MNFKEFSTARKLINLIIKSRIDQGSVEELEDMGIRKGVDYIDGKELVKLLRQNEGQTLGVKGLNHHHYYVEASDCIYQLGREDEAKVLGKGAFGEVVEAISEKNQSEKIAIKIQSSHEPELIKHEHNMLSTVGDSKGYGIVAREAILIMRLHPGKNLSFSGASHTQILEEVLLEKYLFSLPIKDILIDFFKTYCLDQTGKSIQNITSSELSSILSDNDALMTHFKKEQYGFSNLPYADCLKEDIPDCSDTITGILLNRVEISDKLEKLTVSLESAIKLNRLHKIGIGHRDIKGENILYERSVENPEINLVDFGLSILEDKFSSLESSGGTLQYVAPESDNDARISILQGLSDEEGSVNDGPLFTYKSDVYSFCRFLVRDLELNKDDIFGLIGQGLSIQPDDRPSMEDIVCGLYVSADPNFIKKLDECESSKTLILKVENLVKLYKELSTIKPDSIDVSYKKKFVESRIVEKINIRKERVRSIYTRHITIFDSKQPLSVIFAHGQGKSAGFTGTSTRYVLNELGFMKGRNLTELGNQFLSTSSSLTTNNRDFDK